MNLPLIRLRCRAAKQKRPEIWIVLSVSQVLRLVDLQPCIESIGMLTSDELRHADKSQRWHRNHSDDELVADAARLSSPIPRKSHLRRAGWDYGGVDGRDRAARRQSGTLLRVTVGVVGQAGPHVYGVDLLTAGLAAVTERPALVPHLADLMLLGDALLAGEHQIAGGWYRVRAHLTRHLVLPGQTRTSMPSTRLHRAARKPLIIFIRASGSGSSPTTIR